MHTISRYTIRTSGRRVFRRCLRKWGFQSSMRRNLQGKGSEQNINFWFGTAIHFAMEDFFGYNRFGDLQKAFQAYYAAFPASDRPPGADEHYYLGLGMLDYFKTWYQRKNQDHGFQTVWLNPDGSEAEPGAEGARPLVEESFMLDMGLRVYVRQDNGQIAFKDFDALSHAIEWGNVYYDEELNQYYILERAKERSSNLSAQEVAWEQAKMQVVEERVYLRSVPIYYHGTLDRIVKDRQGRWWIMDWKTAKSADTNKLDTDDQISSYLWAAEQWFGRPIHGFMYVQLTKDLAKPPKRLGAGGISVDKKQKTTHAIARQEIIKVYGDVRRAPAKVIEYLNFLATVETPEGDRFVRWDQVTRTQAQKISTYHHIMGELSMMTDPGLYLYPNPTRDCIWDCPFREGCLMLERGEQQEFEVWVDINFEQRPRDEDGNIDPWRENIPWPGTNKYAAIGTMVEQMEIDAKTTLNIIMPDKYRDDYSEEE